VDRRFRKSVRRRGGRSKRRPGPIDDVRRTRDTVQSQPVQPGKRGVERDDAAAEGVQAGHPTDQDRRRHRRPGQDIGHYAGRVIRMTARDVIESNGHRPIIVFLISTRCDSYTHTHGNK